MFSPLGFICNIPTDFSIFITNRQALAYIERSSVVSVLISGIRLRATPRLDFSINITSIESSLVTR